MRFYVHIAHRLVHEPTTGDAVDLSGLGAWRKRVHDPGLRGPGLSACRQAVSALRSIVRFLALEGVNAVALDDAVLSAAG